VVEGARLESGYTLWVSWVRIPPSPLSLIDLIELKYNIPPSISQFQPHSIRCLSVGFCLSSEYNLI
jgi:hypothetical protein